MTVRTQHVVEVLAPAGGPDCLPAAVAGGANAVFLGLRHFNARGRAENFRTAELPHHVAYLHHHGLKCYVVMNTLIHDDEYPKALTLAAAAQESGVDAVIVQDLGLWHVLAKQFPHLKRHASTQMTVHDPSQIEELARVGAERVILARELGLDEIARCTRVANDLGVETEAFVHGALCYAFSGQCLMSNFSGCRSANRGTCAQNCRFDYTAEGAAEPDTVISMKDLSAAHRIAELADAGVSSLKIEGRLKGPEYVYTTSRVYRAAVDAWREGRPFDAAWAADLLKDVFARPQTDAPFDREYSDASRLHRYAPETDRAPDATVVAADTRRGEVTVESPVPVTAGQGYAFTVGRWNGGFLVLTAQAAGRNRWKLTVRSGMRLPPLPPGTGLFRNADHARKREAAAAMAAVPIDAVPEPTVAVDLVLSGAEGQPLTVAATVADGRIATVIGSVPLAPAANAPLSEALVRDKLGAFGGTAYHAAAIRLDCAAGLFVPAGELKALRRALVEALDSAKPTTKPMPEASVAPGAVVSAPSSPHAGVPAFRHSHLWVSVGSLAAARAALAAGASAAWLDDPTLDLWGAHPPTLDTTGIPSGSLWLRHPPTAPVSPHLAAIGLPVVAGHLGVIAAARNAGLPVIVDHYGNSFGLAAADAYAAHGALGVVLSLECSSREVQRLAARRTARVGDTALVALTVHGRVPSMLTRQDHALAPGESRAIQATPADGGLPYELQRRRFGRTGGDTVIWEGRRLCAPAATAATAGLVDAWLLELADLDPAAVDELVMAYYDLRAAAEHHLRGAPPVVADDADVPAEIPRDTADTTLREVIARIESLARQHAPAGLFPGHLLRGSRDLDAVDASRPG
jgi:putative protease